MTISIPDQGTLELPVRLPLGEGLVRNQYVAFGDSITRGDGSSPGRAYPAVLEASLRASLGAAWVENRGASGTASGEGFERVKRMMNDFKPAHVLVLYGTNDWNFPQCQTSPAAACFTIDELRKIIEFIKGRRSLTLLSTLPPVSINTGRNLWIEEMNVLIKALAREQGVPVVDAYSAFRSAGNLTSLYFDDVHPNDAGYRLLAEAFARTLTTGRAAEAMATVPEEALVAGLLQPEWHSAAY